MIGLEFDSNAPALRCVLVHQERAQIWDAQAPGWVDPPADGSIPPGAILAPGQTFAKTPKLAGLYRQAVAISDLDYFGSSLAVFSVDSRGKLLDRIAFIPGPFPPQLTLYATGAWTRGSV